MSTALALLPFDNDYDPRFGASMSVLGCNLGGALYDVLTALPEQQPVPDNFMSYCSRDGAYEDTHFGVTKRDSNGEVVQCLPATVLLRARDHEAVRGNHKNRAVWSYLAELPPETRVALYWH